MGRHGESTWLAALLVVPLTAATGWQHLHFKKIPPNRVEFGAAGLTIVVQSSASPLVYPLDRPWRVQSMRVKARRDSPLALSGAQGAKQNDDFALRVGLVVAGTKRLNALTRLSAADWVKRLHGLAPAGRGIDRIEFFNFVEPGQELRGSRPHPKSDLLRENFVASIGATGKIDQTVRLDAPLEILAIWISVDGDDSRSKFTTVIERLELEGE